MITKIQLENLKINGWTVDNFEIDLNSGLNIVQPDHCDFIISIFKYIISRCDCWYREKYLLAGNIEPINKDDLVYITLCCTYKDSVIKYSSTYADNKIFMETITINDILVGQWDYSEDTLEKGIIYWDTFGGLGNFEMVNIDTKLLCNTLAGKIITESMKDYVICDTSSPSLEMSDYLISQKLSYGEKDRIPMLNKLYPILGFDIEIDNKHLVHTAGNNLGISIKQQGSGFLHLLEILPKLIYCKEKNLVLIIPYYDSTLHYLVKKAFKELLENFGVSIIASSWLE